MATSPLFTSAFWRPPSIGRKRWFVPAALALSLLVHGLFFYFSGSLHVGSLAIPAEKNRMTKPTNLKRVEIPPTAVDQPPPTPVPPPPQVVQNAPARLPEPSPQMVEKGLLGAPAPSTSMPVEGPGSVPAFTPVVPAPPAAASPYALDDRAKLDAEVAKFSLAPTAPGLPNATPSTLPPAPGNPSAVGSALPGQGKGGDPVPALSALPTPEQIGLQFRTPPPALNPNLPQPVVLTLPTDILFDFDSAQLRPGAEAVLAQALQYISKYFRADVEVDGFTDSFGKDDYNQKLSLDRAAAVQAWLRQRLAETKFSVSAKGFGATRPVVPTTGTIEQQQKNRRVEIIVRALSSS
ncbi:MAG TPA: OmpA family protein [Candidatus Methylacidiphilales bacterium]